MGVVRVEKYWQIRFFAKAVYDSGDLARTHELPFPFGDTNEYWDVDFPGRCENCLHQDEVRDIEMAKGADFLLQLSQSVP
jgi:hypothetical protein